MAYPIPAKITIAPIINSPYGSPVFLVGMVKGSELGSPAGSGRGREFILDDGDCVFAGVTVFPDGHWYVYE